MEQSGGVSSEFDETLRFHDKWQVSKKSTKPCPEAVITPIEGHFDPHTQHLNNGYIPATLDLKAFPKADFPINQREGSGGDKNGSDSKNGNSNLRINDDNDDDVMGVAATIPFVEGDYKSEEKEKEEGKKEEDSKDEKERR